MFVLIYFIFAQNLAKSYFIFKDTVSVNSGHFDLILVLFKIWLSHLIFFLIYCF